MNLLESSDHIHSHATARALRRRHARGDIRRLRPGSFTPSKSGSPESEHRLLLTATKPHLKASTVISHTSAALLHGLPVPEAALRRVTVTRPSGGAVSTYLHARRGLLSSEDIRTIDGFTTTTLERTIRDIAATLPFPQALAIADAACQLGLHTERVDATGRSRRSIEHVIQHADPRAESVAESLSRAAMIMQGIPLPELQYEVFACDGTLIGRTDFAWPKFRVLGEVDGRVKYTGAFGEASDPATVIMAEKRREWRLRDLGFNVIRWDWTTLHDTKLLAHRITSALEAAG